MIYDLYSVFNNYEIYIAIPQLKLSSFFLMLADHILGEIIPVLITSKHWEMTTKRQKTELKNLLFPVEIILMPVLQRTFAFYLFILNNIKVLCFKIQ